jgi:hypothetical protein
MYYDVYLIGPNGIKGYTFDDLVRYSGFSESQIIDWFCQIEHKQPINKYDDVFSLFWMTTDGHRMVPASIVSTCVYGFVDQPKE